MPQIKFEKVVEVSSEDTVNDYVASNLLLSGEYKKWKCAKWDSSAFVVLKMCESSRITCIEIGNDSSAFVEVLVARSKDAQTPKFQVLLSTSSFMTPSESNSLLNCNRVRIFNEEKLSPNAVKEKWDLVKVVCNQPFNKNITFGLSFIQLNSPAVQKEEDEGHEQPSAILNIGPFKFSYDDKDEDEDGSLTAGSLFAKRSQADSDKNESTLSKAIGMRASPILHTPTTSNSTKTVQKTRAKASKESTKTQAKPPPASTVTTQRVAAPTVPKVVASPPPAKRPRIPKNVPFSKIMSKVVFMLSGFVNPNRSNLRDKAIQMGARYKANWDSSCTHLICAFVNTPKYIEVSRQNGRIVTEKWINDCFSQKKRLPWRNYILGKYNGPDSDDETDDEDKESNVANNSHYEEVDDDDVPQTQNSTDAGSKTSSQTNLASDVTSNNLNSQINDPIYDAETDNESNNELSSQGSSQTSVKSQNDTNAASAIKCLDIFKGKLFHLYGNFDESERNKLTQYIVSYQGKLTEDLKDSNLNIVVTRSEWNDFFEEACDLNETLIFVKPNWIYRCHEKCKLVPYQAFIVAAKDE